MKFSYQWLQEMVPGLETDPSRLERLITMKTAECEGLQIHNAHFAQVIVARVTSATRLPKGKNTLVTIDVADGKTHQVVCGAPNVAVGMLAAWMPPGTTVGGRTLGVAVIDGVESEGMLASAAELGINRDHSGLLALRDGSPGQPLPELRPDCLIEIDNKSLTHRPDLWGHYGMAREIAALVGRSLQDPVDLRQLPAGSGHPITVTVHNTALCPRYSALLVEDLQVAASPLSLQARLESVGMNAINNVVDVTNFVLAELPQPMHAFDADKLRGGIEVRLAHAGESLQALNGETYELTAADLVIADDSGPIALAGVIGGVASAISDATTRIVLESANFQAATVRLTSARHKLRTDASMRFEKSLDRTNTLRGLARAAELLRKVCPGARPVGPVIDVGQDFQSPPPIPLAIEFVSRKLGQAVTGESISRILGSLGFGVTRTGADQLMVAIPSWRATKDIASKEDLVEEVGRMIGYDEIAPRAPAVASVVPPPNPMRAYVRRLRAAFAAQGFTEVYNYSFVNEKQAHLFALPLATHIGIRNPIASEQTHLRTSLLPGIFENIRSNIRHSDEFRIFEIGNQIQAAADEASEARETPVAAGALYNLHGTPDDFFEAKRVIECALPKAALEETDARPFEHPFRTAAVWWHRKPVGRLFELHPSLLHRHDIPGRAIVFELNLQASAAVAATISFHYQPLRKYPTSGFDLSVIAPLQLPVAKIEEELRQLAGVNLAHLEFVRQYAGQPLADGEKSVSYHMEVGALDRTLTAEEAGEIRARMIEGMRALGYELRV